MRVALGVTVLARGVRSGGVDGIGSYTRELLKRFNIIPDVELHPVSFGGDAADHLEECNVTRIGKGYAISACVSAATRTPFIFRGSSRFASGIDLFHATDHLIPNLGKTPVIASIMDAVPLSHPQWVTPRFRKAKNWLWKVASGWADHVITISHYSKREISEHFGICEKRISVVPLGVDERWFAPLNPSELKESTQLLGLPERYVLFVGTLQPRKNLLRLIAAYRSLPHSIRREIPLVIVGRAGWMCQDILDEIHASKNKGTIRWLEYLPDNQMLAVMKRAGVLVFPSLYEGFGLPVLEAFAAGAPVITSNTTALPEVAGDAALLVDPYDFEEIGAAIQSVLEKEEVAEDLRRRGLRRARGYSWDRTASMTREVYRHVLST